MKDLSMYQSFCMKFVTTSTRREKKFYKNMGSLYSLRRSRRFRVHGVRTKMAMRLYHRRSSATREKIHIQNGLSSNSSLRLQVLGACGHRDSIGVNRQRSQSLYPGSPNCLGVPTRSRSHSFSGPSKTPKLPEKQLTASEEERIFQCYTRVMYILLGGMAAVVMTLVLYGIRSFTTIT